MSRNYTRRAIMSEWQDLADEQIDCDRAIAEEERVPRALFTCTVARAAIGGSLTARAIMHARKIGVRP